ncbi:HEPN domain-containing protein [candidate division KSB1 bacterium]|nr:HEPN domain-containing protein [candidate division KSB1 bacterium]MBL7095248.1 HEPN domain-containing protein [candidate division KSB1 bacterium]
MAKGSLKLESFKLLSRSKENLKEMKTLLKSALYYGAVNRAYYAIFQTISALILFDHEIEFSSHKAVISYFGKNYAKEEKAPQEYHRIFINTFNIRQMSDYDYDAIVTKEQAEEIAENAKEIVDYVDKHIS